MDRETAAIVLYKATHNICVPWEDFLEATQWFLWYFKAKPTSETVHRMKNWSEVMMSMYHAPYRHINAQV